MLGTYRLPNGVGMARAPANTFPPGSVWLGTPSPASARYSPLVMSWVVAFGATAFSARGSGPGIFHTNTAMPATIALSDTARPKSTARLVIAGYRMRRASARDWRFRERDLSGPPA